MDRLKKARAPLRAVFTRTVNEINQDLSAEEKDEDVVKVKLERLERVIRDIRELNEKLLEALLDAEVTENEYAEEVDAIQDYEDKLSAVKVKITQVFNGSSRTSSPTGSANEYNTATSGTSSALHARKFRLPKIELKKFNGEITEWLGFWSQFNKIHEDEELTEADKFLYLSQSMVKGSRAQEVVDSFPQTADNYDKAVTALKARFGKEELLVEVYVRELLKLVIHNVSVKEKGPLSKMYDKIECQLRALDSLGVTSEKNGSMLMPLVESSLPEEVLRAWQRCRQSTDSKVKSRINCLLEFLRNEVESEERISLAKAGFGVASESQTKTKREETKGERQHTAASLHSGEVKDTNCIFCGKIHDSKECFKAQSMTLADKKKALSDKKCCFVCFRKNHQSKDCKASVRCVVCGKKHFALMCPQLPQNAAKEEEKDFKKVGSNSSALTSQACTNTVVLQTLLVRMIGNGTEKVVRALIDSGAQRSYVLKSSAEVARCQALKEEKIAHSLFGGVETSYQDHKSYLLELQSLDRKCKKKIKVLDQQKICGQIPRVKIGPWMTELKRNGIWINDCGPDCPEIEVLIGADVYGKLLTGRIVQLKNGLTAVETVLGWTLTGEHPGNHQSSSVSMMVTSMLVNDASLAELWKLDAIGIMDSSETKSREELETTAKEHFLQNIKVDENGRYEVSLPWVEGHQQIADNRFIAVKRLITTTPNLT